MRNMWCMSVPNFSSPRQWFFLAQLSEVFFYSNGSIHNFMAFVKKVNPFKHTKNNQAWTGSCSSTFFPVSFSQLLELWIKLRWLWRLIHLNTWKKTKQNKTKQKNKTKQNKTKQSETKQSKTKQNKTTTKQQQRKNQAWIRTGSRWAYFFPAFIFTAAWVVNKTAMIMDVSTSFYAVQIYDISYITETTPDHAISVFNVSWDHKKIFEMFSGLLIFTHPYSHCSKPW